MNRHPHALILAHPVLPELLTLFEGYLHTYQNLSYLLCSNIEPVGPFVIAQVIRDTHTQPWPVQIPISCIAAIADISSPKAAPGFLSGNL